MKPKRAALYLRVSTGEQTTDNQRLALEAACEQRGWQVVATYADPCVSGAKGRDERPEFDRMLKDAARGQPVARRAERRSAAHASRPGSSSAFATNWRLVTAY